MFLTWNITQLLEPSRYNPSCNRLGFSELRLLEDKDNHPQGLALRALVGRGQRRALAGGIYFCNDSQRQDRRERVARLSKHGKHGKSEVSQ